MAIAPEPGKTKCPTCSSAMAGGRDQGRGSDRAVSRLPRMWSSAQGTRRSILVALRLVGPAVSARAPAWTQSRRCPQSGQLSSRGARRALVALQQCLGEIALVEERIDPLSNAARRVPECAHPPGCADCAESRR